MLDALSRGFRSARNKLTGKAELTEESVVDALRDVRVSLLEADVELGRVYVSWPTPPIFKPATWCESSTTIIRGIRAKWRWQAWPGIKSRSRPRFRFRL